MPDQLEEELRRIAAALVEEAPPPPPLPDISDAGALARPRPARRVVLGVGLAAAALAAVVVVVRLPSSDDRASVAAGPTSQTTKADPHADQERLILRQSVQEVAADGSLRDLPVPPGVAATGAFPLSDGRTVLLGSRDLQPGVARRDGPNVEGVAFPLIVTAPDGKVLLERDVRVRGQWVQLLAATATEAILYRGTASGDRAPRAGGQIVAHSFASGEERLVGQPVGIPRAGDVAGDVLVVVSDSSGLAGGQQAPALQPCFLQIFRLDGEPSGHKQLPMPACVDALGVNASPDAQYAAVAYGVITARYEHRLALMALDGSGARSDEALGNPIRCSPDQCPGVRPLAFVGTSWVDTTTYRIALNDLQKSPPYDRVTAESLRLISRTATEAMDRPQIEVAVATEALGPLEVTVGPARTAPPDDSRAWLVHDLTLTNGSDSDVFVNDFKHSLFLGDGHQLLVGIGGCGYGSADNHASVQPACRTVYEPLTLKPHESRTFTVTLWKALQGMAPLTAQSLVLDQHISYRGLPPRHPSTAQVGPFTDPRQTASPNARIMITYTLPSGAPPAKQ